MSSKPSPGGVERLRALLRRRRELSDEIEGIEKRLPRLAAAKDEEADNYKELVKLINAMDTASPGNWGFEGRLVWMLGELDRQALEEACMNNQPSLGAMPDEVVATNNENEKGKVQSP